ncbi:uncharacterized protein LOC111069044 [Drosophila obscura]|uniref:uncharacterized protein LOC111069044 n=1 Tax=Drosophila obscura TaxID=7282 RepID=UPI001BB146D5|nr:uncharacterized protein LOC111069044 [Drosophila obscura]
MRGPLTVGSGWSTVSALQVVLWLLLGVGSVLGHGRLMDPPARNAMWRFGYPNPVNYNDNELFCGGYAVQWEQNSGRCGVCGDAYHVKSPRPHEAGGEFAKGIISRYYTSGQEIEVEVELTANHYGRFEMFLCPNNNPRQEATQECFDRYPLLISGSREHRYLIPRDAKKKDIFRYRVRLPAYVTCTQCVLQWTYYTANMWGTCANGTEAVGCGKAETFRNCADIAIISNTGGGVPPIFVNNKSPYLLYYRDYRAPEDNNVFPLIVRDQKCIGAPAFRTLPGIDHWCEINCLRYPPNCPEEACFCPQECVAIGELAGREGADTYCMDECLNYESDCPRDRCRCQ